MTVLLLGLSCSTNEPLPLPEPTYEAWRPKGRMVSAGALRGYLVKPQTTPAPGVLVLVDDITPAARTAADQRAISGSVVLMVEPDTETARAADYLNRLESTRGIQTHCQRRSCP